MLDSRIARNFPNEVALVGRMLAGYADLEIDLMRCAQVVCVDFDTVLKAMFRSRGETNRINVADAFGRQRYLALGIGEEFEKAIGVVRYCLKIRNQYAHCKWWDDGTEQLAFANLEEIAQENSLVMDYEHLTTHHVNVSLLEAQLAYFMYAENLFIWLIQEGNARADRPALPNRIFPIELERPALFIL
jgi:hypothetical protein